MALPVFAYTRSLESATILVVLNFHHEQTLFPLPESGMGQCFIYRLMRRGFIGCDIEALKGQAL